MAEPLQAVLLAEDNAFQRDVVSSQLEQGGRFHVTACPDGVAALEELRERDYDVDLLLTDIKMPRLDGVGLLEALHEEAPDLPAVVLSAERDEGLILECLRLGAADYLFKSASRSAGALQEKLVDVLLRRGHYGPAAPPKIKRDADGWVTLTGMTNLEYIARFRDFSESLFAASMPAEDRATMRFVIDELGRNAAEWGNGFDGDKRLQLSYRLSRGRVEIRVRDEGQGFDLDTLRDPAGDMAGHVRRRMASGKRPGGFGIALVRKMMDEVHFNPAGNEVVAVKFLQDS